MTMLTTTTMMNMQQATEAYIEYLDEVHAPYIIGDRTFYASRILREIDPIAFDCDMTDFLDAMGIELE